MNKTILSGLLVAIVALQGSCTPLPTAKITEQAVDESGAPIEGVNASISFRSLKTNNPWTGQKSQSIQGITDKEGKHTASNPTLNSVGIGAWHDDYYSSSTEYTFSDKNGSKWTPYNPTVMLVLRKIENPAAMWAKNLSKVEIPAVGNPVGYDLLKGDRVVPHGKGTISDLLFTLELDLKDGWNYSGNLKVEMPNDGDGFTPIPDASKHTESRFILPRYAPIEGYSSDLMVEQIIQKDTNTYSLNSSIKERNVFIRLRTVKDEDGNVKEALYGKITNHKSANTPIRWRIVKGEQIYVEFTYYVNPDKTRNMEYDIEQNLFLKDYVGRPRGDSSFNNLTP